MGRMLADLRGRSEEERALRQATELRARRLEVRALSGERASRVYELHVALDSALEASKRPAREGLGHDENGVEHGPSPRAWDHDPSAATRGPGAPSWEWPAGPRLSRRMPLEETSAGWIEDARDGFAERAADPYFTTLWTPHMHPRTPPRAPSFPTRGEMPLSPC